jgi:hypothetical protein
MEIMAPDPIPINIPKAVIIKEMGMVTDRPEMASAPTTLPINKRFIIM